MKKWITLSTHSVIVVVFLVISIKLVICNEEPRKDETKETTPPPEPQNLYKDGGVVINLEEPTYYPKVRDSERTWLVLFYMSWCGHCIHYVPSYISIAEKLKVWSDYTSVAAINCAKSTNGALCRDHNITGYPTVAYIASHTKNTSASMEQLPYDKIKDEEFVTGFMEEKIKTLFPTAKPRSEVAVTHPQGNPGKEGGDKTESHNTPSMLITQANSSILFYEDLVYALQYSLVTEVGLHKVITGGALTALKDYVNILSMHFSELDQVILSAIRSLNEKLKPETNYISYTEWMTLLEESGLTAAVRGKYKLIRCRGSISKYRGYPCSLWSLFHTLSVHATVPAVPDKTDKKTRERDDLSSHAVLLAMRGYIANFFSCKDCSAHFAKMAVEMDAMTDKSNKASVLWLWSAHNKVNKRLSGEDSEDPKFPKTQFPSHQECPHCKTPKGIWDEEIVYDFLHSTYTQIRHKDAVQLINKRNLQLVRDHHYSQPKYAGSWNPIGLSRIEMSMCYVLYMTSAIVIGVLFYFIVIKQRIYLRYRKCPPKVHDRYTYDKPIY